MAIQNFVAPENITYCGKEANEILSKPIFETNLYGYGITYRPDVKGKEQLVMGELSDVFQAYSCSFNAQGEVNLDEAWIEPFEIMVNMQNCYDKFWKTFLAEETRIAYVGESAIPRTFFEWFSDKLVAEMKHEYEDIFFNGDSAYTGSTRSYLKLGDGIVTKLMADSKTNKIVGAALTVNNVLSQIEAVAEKASVDVADEDYKIFVNKGQMKLILTALGNAAISEHNVWSNWTKGADGKVYAFGFEVVPSAIEKDTIMLAPVKNMVLGYDLQSDATSFQILDLSKVTGDNEFRVIALTNMAVGVVYPELFVISRP